MKIQLDTTAKIIRFDEVINLGDFFDKIQEMLPGDIWREFTVDVSAINTVIWRDPWTWPILPSPTVHPSPPWIVTYGIGVQNGIDSITPVLLDGVYNIEA